MIKHLRQVVVFGGNIGPKFGFRVRAFATTALLAASLIFAFRAFVRADNPNLSGTYMADDGGIYYVQQSGNTLWWAGMSLDTELPPDAQWHRGLNFTNVFTGTINSNNTVSGQWADVTRGATLNQGTLTMIIGTSGGVPQLTKLSSTGGFGASTLTQAAPLDDTKQNGFSLDIFSRFDAVRKNDDSTLLNPNLKPYRDATVFYGRVTISQLQYLNDNCLESEFPHVNYGTDYSPAVQNGSPCPGNDAATYHDFGHFDREFHAFAGASDDGDGDFDMRVKIDLNKLEPNFYDLGWENHLQAPDILRWKITDSNTQQQLGYTSTDGYMGAETIMYGRPPDCSDTNGTGFCSACAPPPFCDLYCSLACHLEGGVALLPGWADLFANSVLINGRPINGLFSRIGSSDPTCDFNEPCPQLDPLGIKLSNLSLIDGTYVRITGALVLDCGHGITHDCFDDPSDRNDVSGHQNQEIHPVYSIDIINFPFRPEDSTVSARPNLTGTWGGSDGSTYFIRQIGNAVWLFGLLRDRQPSQQSTSYDLIGTPQVAAAGLLVGSPICGPSVRCWMFGTVVKGTLSLNSDGSATIQGNWAGVQQSTSPGSTGGTVTLAVDKYHKLITPQTMQVIFPDTIQKMYEPATDTVPPQSVVSIGTPQYQSGGTLFVTVATPFTVSAIDTGSGVQNVWYRYYLSGSLQPPAYTPVIGTSTTFHIAGPDGIYVVETYATDNAGNDEAPHALLAGISTAPPPSGTACNGVYGGSFAGNITVSSGQVCTIFNGSVTGNVIVKPGGSFTVNDGNVSGNVQLQGGGNLLLTGTTEGGNVQITGGGTFTIGPGATIGKNLEIQNLPNGTGHNQICGSNILGNLLFRNNGTAVDIGAPGCAGNAVGGSLQVQNNNAAVNIFGNTVGNNLQCNNNAPAPAGSGNTAKSKQGQCSSF